MSYKEVTALRKSGNLESALAMARADYERLQGQWESSALFWCLNDKYKTIPDVSERKTVIDEMHELAGMMPGEDEFIGKALAAADKWQCITLTKC